MAEPFAHAFFPLPGTKPSHLEHTKGCRWPVTVEGNQLFCDQPIKPGSRVSWCHEHCEVGYAKRITRDDKKTVSKNKS